MRVSACESVCGRRAVRPRAAVRHFTPGRVRPLAAVSQKIPTFFTFFDMF